ncbi:shikimate kinase [Lentilactobacillus curieae]|uniref:Shikimate kinase n=1 Tax=Lentilactobacillus curieae TaxID=1138822 RepID=A0A1S6QGC6_9LACO|nr:shikimate kinase [Lentilactobacillus curieae]AQW20655.1 shikimate kinase [Lentilactobacillus curieae]
MDLILVGFMGSGKTTVGKLLADRLGKQYFDLDQLIVEQTGMSIPQIFAERGEDGFRMIEQQCLQSTNEFPGILGTGGGTPMQRNNQEFLGKAGAPVVLLSASIKTILARLAGDNNRPLVEKLGAAGLADLQAQRHDTYLNVSDLQVATDELTPFEVADKIIDQLKVAK